MQSEPQLTPEGELVTVPDPVPDFEVVSVYVVTAKFAVTERLATTFESVLGFVVELSLQFTK